jgi:hypothetical protein
MTVVSRIITSTGYREKGDGMRKSGRAFPVLYNPLLI